MMDIWLEEQTSAILFGGKTNPPPSRIGVVESYDGVSFTEVNDLNTARAGAFGGGISNTSAIAVWWRNRIWRCDGCN